MLLPKVAIKNCSGKSKTRTSICNAYILSSSTHQLFPAWGFSGLDIASLQAVHLLSTCSSSSFNIYHLWLKSWIHVSQWKESSSYLGPCRHIYIEFHLPFCCQLRQSYEFFLQPTISLTSLNKLRSSSIFDIVLSTVLYDYVKQNRYLDGSELHW